MKQPSRTLPLGLALLLALGIARAAAAQAPVPSQRQAQPQLQAERLGTDQGRVTGQGAGPAPARGAAQAKLPDSQAILDAPEELFDLGQVRELRLRFASSDWQGLLQRGRAQGKDVPVTLTVEGQTLEQVGLRYKGNTSLGVSGPKKPLNLDLDAFVPGQKLWGYDVINLNNGWADPSQLREALAFTLLRSYMPVPQVSYAKVYANDTYVGLYLMMEQIDKTFVERWFATRTGLIFKGDNPNDIMLDSSTLNYQSALRAYKTGYELKTEEAGDEGYRQLQGLTQVLDATAAQGGVTDQAFPAKVQEVLDVDLALWYLAGNNLLCNFDSYYAGHNYYLYSDSRDPRFSMLNWDWNLSFGTFQLWFARAGRPIPETDPFEQSTQRNRPLVRRLLRVPEFRADYIAHLRTLRDEALDPAIFDELAEDLHALIAPAAAAEPKPLYPPELFAKNLREDVTINLGGVGQGQQLRVLGLLPFSVARRGFLQEQAALASPNLSLQGLALEPAQPATGQTVRVRAVFTGTQLPAGAELRYRVERGPETRLAMQAAGPGAWTAELPSQSAGRDVTYFFRVAGQDGRASFFPAANQTRPYQYRVAGVELPQKPAGDLVINEVLADNQQGLKDPAGELDDWVELYNRGAQPLSLAGWYLSDRADSPWDHALPPLTLAPRGRLLIWADGQPEQGPEHAPFRLSRSGETLVLTRQDGLYDRVDFGALPPDQSLGRRLDGEDTWVPCWPPSPGGRNDCRARGWRSFLPRLQIEDLPPLGDLHVGQALFP